MVVAVTPKPIYINELYQSDPYTAPVIGPGYDARDFSSVAGGVQVVLKTAATEGFTIQDSLGNDSFNLTNVYGPTTDVLLNGGHDTVTFGAGNQYVLAAAAGGEHAEYATMIFKAGVSATQGAATHGYSNMYFGAGFGAQGPAGLFVYFQNYGPGAHLVQDGPGDFGAPAAYYHVEDANGVWLTGKFEALQGLDANHYALTNSLLT